MINQRRENSSQKNNSSSKNKVISLLFVVIFTSILLSFPIMHLFGVSAGKNYEQKILAEAPTIEDLIGDYPNFSNKYTAHFNDHFPFKSKMLELSSLFEYKVFDNSLLPSVTSVGKNGWLFYEAENTRRVVSGEYMLTEEQLETIYQGIMYKYQVLSSLGKKYVIYLAPEKQIIYPEYDKLLNSDYTLIDQLRDYLTQKGCPVPFVYGKDYLLTKKTATNQLYFKYDTHWNGLGAQYGYESLMQIIAPMFEGSNLPICTEFETGTFTRSGDLAGTIYLSDYLTESAPYLIYSHTPTVLKDGTIISDVDNDLKLFIYGDSFAQSDYWSVPFAQSFSRINIMHNRNDFPALLEKVGDADIVIEECVQRVPTTLGRIINVQE